MPAKKEQPLKNIYLFHGENVFSATNELNHWREEFVKKHGDSDIEIFDKEENVDKIIDAILAAPFLSEKRLVIIKNSMESPRDSSSIAPVRLSFAAAKAERRGVTENFEEKSAKKLSNALDKIPESSVAVFFEEKELKTGVIYKKIREIGNIKLFKVFTEIELYKFIEKSAAEFGSTIKADAINYLIQMTHADAWNIEKELEKLATYCGKREITKKDIDALVTPNLETSIFRFTDEITEKRTGAALNTFRILSSSGETVQRIFSMIVRNFRLLIMARDLLNQNMTRDQIAQKFRMYDPKMHPYTISIYTEKSASFNLEDLKKIYGMLVKLDADQKTGRIRETVDNKTEIMLALEKLIINLCK
ncbi:DNA polymerase III subunit delta [Candidatus Peregrinibacteria bacterium]|nr:DNA polymerase III subunit delta [Candidatus Peregrinibacteria bacterium]